MAAPIPLAVALHCWILITELPIACSSVQETTRVPVVQTWLQNGTLTPAFLPTRPRPTTPRPANGAVPLASPSTTSAPIRRPPAFTSEHSMLLRPEPLPPAELEITAQ